MRQHKYMRSLSPLPTGKGLQVYTSMPAGDSNNYEQLKAALLKRYRLTADGFHKKFREQLPELGESVFQYIARLSRYLQRWIELTGIEKTFDGLCDLLLCEQYLNTCSTDLAIFVRERAPRNVTELTKLAEQYMAAHESVEAADSKSQKHKMNVAVTQENQQEDKLLSSIAAARQRQTYRERRCFICNRRNHIARDCYYRDQHNRQTEDVGNRQHEYHRRASEGSKRNPAINEHNNIQMPVCEGYVNMYSVQVLRDTGCSSAAVRKEDICDQRSNDQQNRHVRPNRWDRKTIPSSRVAHRHAILRRGGGGHGHGESSI